MEVRPATIFDRNVRRGDQLHARLHWKRSQHEWTRQLPKFVLRLHIGRESSLLQHHILCATARRRWARTQQVPRQNCRLRIHRLRYECLQIGELADARNILAQQIHNRVSFQIQNSAGRRYDLIKYDNGNTFGREAEQMYHKCESSSYRVESWTRWFVQCSNCFCYCDEQINSDRYFSLRDVVSNIHRNQ